MLCMTQAHPYGHTRQRRLVMVMGGSTELRYALEGR